MPTPDKYVTNVWALLNKIVTNSLIAAILILVLVGIYDLELRRISKQNEIVDRLITLVEFCEK